MTSTALNASTFTSGIRTGVLRRAGGDCTDGGITSRATSLTVVAIDRGGEIEVLEQVWPEIEARSRLGHQFNCVASLHPVTDDAPAVVLVIEDPNGDKRHRNVFLRPVDPRHACHGGNFAADSGANWRWLLRRIELPNHAGALRVHDRFGA